ncbi:MAG: SO2930 family diheme c-type cytochrome [Myxococcota bacterium]
MTYRSMSLCVSAALFASLTLGCGPKQEDCTLNLPADGEPHERLSDYCFFQGDPEAHQVSERVVAYNVSTKLYADKSDKYRFIALPDGETVSYDDEQMWEFPDGAILVKTFYYPVDARDRSKGDHLLETRLLMKHEGEWESQVYVWNEDQSDAVLDNLGSNIQVEWIDKEGTTQTQSYQIPSWTACKNCHGQNDVLEPLGPRTRQLNKTNTYGGEEKNQIAHMAELGFLDTDIGDPSELPALINPKDESHPLDQRARTYLEGNCAHCHRPEGSAANTGLYLNIEEENERSLGVCKSPISAGTGAGGRAFDIVPGKPEESITIFRMKSLNPEIKMPELPTRTVDEFGVDIVSQWILEMDGSCE